jgi:hypothetical protein
MDGKFYAMHVSNRNYYMHISCRIRGTKRKFSSYMRIEVTEDSQGYYNHREEVRGLHVSSGITGIDSNERGYRHDPVTMRSLHREVMSYITDNERIMKAHEEILKILNMLHKQVNKDS